MQRPYTIKMQPFKEAKKAEGLFHILFAGGGIQRVKKASKSLKAKKEGSRD